MSHYKRKTTLAEWTPERRKQGQKAGQRLKKFDDGLTTCQRTAKRIKEAANGCWWVEQYIRGSITYTQSQNDRMKGIDDE